MTARVKINCDYGDLVAVSKEAPPRFLPGSQGAVVSIYEVEKKPYAEQLGVPVGTVVVGIEKEDGTFFEVAAYYIEKLVPAGTVRKIAKRSQRVFWR